ncbi:Zn-dependent exopeptidase [Dendrothele bispora CBS 962.96]|uniref:Zn-dependent exopeptidase n=1 Tax=Dendrothele bispora (strain CBS 962.96) TaxID=1314807 RepID=A0A4V4HAR8_DENBC|nr:Zn-dependent exopeptidase [Dendrothele bispora CBS 962.96]
MPAPKEFLDFVDKNADKFIQRLSEAVSYQSVSGNPDHRQDVINMSKWMYSQLQGVGIETRLVELGNQKDQDGNDMGIPLPPVVLELLRNDANKQTVLVYGHLDVQPRNPMAGALMTPFKLEIFDNGQLVGRGATDDKARFWDGLTSFSIITKPINLGAFLSIFDSVSKPWKKAEVFSVCFIIWEREILAKVVCLDEARVKGASVRVVDAEIDVVLAFEQTIGREVPDVDTPTGTVSTVGSTAHTDFIFFNYHFGSSYFLKSFVIYGPTSSDWTTFLGLPKYYE